jgi:hypothetical protein
MNFADKGGMFADGEHLSYSQTREAMREQAAP